MRLKALIFLLLSVTSKLFAGSQTDYRLVIENFNLPICGGSCSGYFDYYVFHDLTNTKVPISQLQILPETFEDDGPISSNTYRLSHLCPNTSYTFRVIFTHNSIQHSITETIVVSESSTCTFNSFPISSYNDCECNLFTFTASDPSPNGWTLNGNIHPHAMGSGLITHLLYLNINHYQANWEPARKVLL